MRLMSRCHATKPRPGLSVNARPHQLTSSNEKDICYEKIIAPMVAGLVFAVSAVHAEDLHHPKNGTTVDAHAVQSIGKGWSRAWV